MSDYYDILSEELQAHEGVWVVCLRADADVYRGHFPGLPIAPGACNIELIRQLTTRLLHRDCRFSEITQCRFTHLITPHVENPLRVTIRVENEQVQATVCWGETQCISLKAKLKIELC